MTEGKEDVLAGADHQGWRCREREGGQSGERWFNLDGRSSRRRSRRRHAERQRQPAQIIRRGGGNTEVCAESGSLVTETAVTEEKGEVTVRFENTTAGVVRERERELQQNQSDKEVWEL